MAGMGYLHGTAVTATAGLEFVAACDRDGDRRKAAEHDFTGLRAHATVDASFSGWLDFGQGFTAAFLASFEAPERQHLELAGTMTTALVDDAFAAGASGQHGRLLDRNGVVEDVAGPDDDPYRLMVEHFVEVVRGRATPRRPPSASVELLGLLDRLREVAT